MNCFFGSKYGFSNLVVVWGGGGGNVGEMRNLIVGC